MTVYVDDVRWRFGNMIMCHMWADTLDELHAMADAIGVQRKWFQTPPKASWDHYDVTVSKKTEAFTRGAVLTDRYGPVEWQALRDIASGNPQWVEWGEMRLVQVWKSRAPRFDRWVQGLEER